MRVLIAYSTDCGPHAQELITAARQRWLSLPKRPQLQIVPFYEGCGALQAAELINPSDFDLSIFLFWRRWDPAVSRLMTMFYAHFMQCSSPSILVYRCEAPLTYNMGEEAFRDRMLLDEAFKDWFFDADGKSCRAYWPYHSSASLVNSVLRTLNTLFEQNESTNTQQPDSAYELSQLYDSSRDFHFISYARKDFVHIVPFLKCFASHKENFWFDRALPGGGQWWEELGSKILNAKSVIAFLSPAAQASRWVERELTLADECGRLIVPVSLEPVVLTPGWRLLLSTHQIIDPKPDELMVSIRNADYSRT